MEVKHYLILQIILAAISFIVNGLFLIVLVKNKDLVKRKRITYHVANLAVADTLYGLSRVCYYDVLLRQNELTIEKSLPLLIYSISHGFFFASQAAVLLMTFERSIVITKPLTWNAILPRKRMLLFMLCSWIAITLIIVLVYFFWEVNWFVRVAIQIICLGLLLSTVSSVLNEDKLRYNIHVNFLSILENLNFLVNPFVYIWRDRIYRNAFYCTFKIKIQF